MRKITFPAMLLCLYLLVLVPFSAYMKSKPYVEKLGYVPKGEALKYLAADQKEFIAATLILKVLLYFGGLVDKSFNKLDLPVDYPAMSRSLHTAVKLDPYNMDAYYFAQATLVWDAKQIKLANDLLDYGMKYRNWDFYLPFYAGFNSAYFLKDFAKAAQYYKLAGDLSGSELSISLAGRYLYESGQSELAIAYLTVMERGASNETMKKTFAVRLQALKEGRRVELARDKYKNSTGHLPASVEDLLSKGYLEGMPMDPYGGKFYFEPDGSVRSTSKFAFGVAGGK